MTTTTLAVNPVYALIRGLARNRWLKWAGVTIAATAVIGTVISGPPPPEIASIVLSAEPLYAKGARAKPTLTLALSVEFPTVGAQYVAAPGATDDPSYSSATQYIGYFDPTSCYVYNDTPTETLPSGSTAADYKRFDWVGQAPTVGVSPNIVSLHTCNGAGFNGKAFSGNFLNWAGSSAIDILRYGLTGGDRVIDTTNLTVLQRAVLPAGRFWNDSNFPSKQVSGATAAGALPAALLGNYTGTVYVASCFNRIHFGTAKTGNCDSPGNNSNLGVSSTSAAMGPITAYNNPLPNGFSNCASEGGTCNLAGPMRIYFGANNRFFTAAATGPVSCSNNTFGDPISGTYKQCYVGADTSGWAPPSSNGTLTAGAFFYDRVSVCASDAQGNLFESRAQLCLKYPSGKFKPVGELQKYSDKLRVSAFGYLNDSTGDPNQRYGGVLRAPMKYVGPKYYDASFSLVSGTNPNREWDETTGVFFANPDGQTTTPSGPGSSPTGPYLSGVTNYLNQFGRTGTFGSYKTYDPVGELYYEALRYLQGLSPTGAATSGLTSDMKDGYPVFTTWVDPHPPVSGSTDYSCVKNNIVAIGDVNTWNDKSFPGNPASRGGNENPFGSGRAADKTINEPDFHYWTQVVGGFEANSAVTYIDSKGVSRTTSNFNASGTPEAPFTGLAGMADANIGAEGASYYMAGAAYWANTHDIRGSDWSANVNAQRPGMRVKTYVLDVNEFAQQTSPNAHRQNQFYLASKYGGFDDTSGRGSPYVDDKGTSNSNASWERAGASNAGETNNYYLASSAQAVLDGLHTIFDKVATQANSIAGSAASTTHLNSGNNNMGFIYQAQFDPSSWSGNVLAYPIDGSSGLVTLDSNTAPAWDAASTLDALVAVNTAARNIVVGKTAPASGATANPFLWNNLDADAQAALQSPLGIAMGVPTTVAAGQARLNFLRGDRSNEVPSGLGFRKRASVLGDVVNSGVVYSGAPVQRFNDAAYATFYNANKNRKSALFVGANDGMLHAFDPNNRGSELFAYIPSWVMPRIGALTFPAYTHQSYVDATPAVADATVLDPSTGQYVWKTVLVGGTGGGGQGVYALDVSDPAAFNAGKVLWEFNHRDDPEFDLGNVVGRPQILKLRTGSVDVPNYHYFAVVASGVNNYLDDGQGRFSSTGRAAIYLLDLSKKSTDAWAEGSNFFKIRLPSPATGPSAAANGLIGFSVVKGNNDEVAQIYAGDLQGKLWKLDFTQATVGSGGWNLATLSYYNASGPTPVPMYVALDSGGKAQPITMEPAVVYGPNKTRYVAFGTGKFLELPDLQSSSVQSVYAVLDNNAPALDGGTSAAISGRGRLQPGSVNVATGLVSISSFVWGRPQTDADVSIRSGWYFDFTVPGERQISNAEVLSGGLLFGSIIPPVSSCGDGDGNIYSINIASGGGTLVRSPVGLVGQPFSEELGKSTSVSTTDSTGRVKVTKYYQTIIQGAEGLNASKANKPPDTSYAARLNWREISNYQQLKAAP